MFGTYRNIFCNRSQLPLGIRLHYLPAVHLLPQTQLSNPAAQDGFLSARLLRQCLAPAWVCPTGSLCAAGEHTCMGHLIHLKRSESYGISLPNPLHTRCTYIMDPSQSVIQSISPLLRYFLLEVRHPRRVGSITKNFVYYTYSQTQLYFTYKYSKNTTTCFSPICGLSSG